MDFLWDTIKATFRAVKPLAQLILENGKAISKGAIRGLQFVISKADDFIELGKETISLDPMGIVSELLDILSLEDITKEVSYLTTEQKNTWNKQRTIMRRAFNDAQERIQDNKRKRKGERDMNKTNSKSSKRNGDVRAKITTSKKTGIEGSRLARTNHPEWYLKDPTMAKYLVGINLASRLNAENGYLRGFFTDEDNNDQSINYGNYQLSVPSCAGIRMELTIPKSITNDWQQGINLLYKNVRSANAGSTNGILPYKYGNYVHNLRCIDAALSMLYRAITVLNGADFYDAVSPQSYFTAFGLDYDTFAANAANARELYNRLATIRYRLMPLNVTLLDRTRWLFSNGFKDSDDAKAQIYFPYIQLARYIKSDDTTELVVLSREDVNEGITGLEYSDFVSGIQTLFNLYQNDVDAQTIAGDILKAYGESSLNKYPDVPSTVQFTPVYDEHVLTQIQNATISVTGNINVEFKLDSNDEGAFVITELDEIINSTSQQADPRAIELLNQWFINPLYNANTNIVDPGRLLSSTRLMVSRHAVNGGTDANPTGDIIYDTFGTEVVEFINVPMYSANISVNNPYKLFTYKLIWLTELGVETAADQITGAIIPVWTWFDYFPLVMPYYYDRSAKIRAYSPVMFDFNNFGIAYKSNLDSYNAIATLSMLHKAFVAKTNKVELIES